ncbi:ankyrin repeat-containing domain protein [Fusarium oxysporum II5]|nr:ankyrin repeat-containing domain protein [Fusarium oxysporum II5]
MTGINFRTNRDWMALYKQDLAEKAISETSTLEEIACYLFVNREQPDPHQLLILAIEKVDKAVLNALVHNINFKIDINQRDAERRTALTQAMKSGNQEIVEYLLEIEGIDVNGPGQNEDFPITYAIRNNIDSGRDGSHFDLLNLLKHLLDSAKFNPNILDGDSRSPLSLAAQKFDPTVLSALLKSPKVKACSQDKEARTPLIWSIFGNRSESMKLLLEEDDSGVTTPDIEGRTLLSYASEKCNLGMVKSLLYKCSGNADQPDRNGRTPLSWAVQRKPATIVEYLINTGHADPHFKDNNKRTPFSWAVETENLDTIKYLADHPKVDINDPDKDRRTPLSWSAGQGPITVVEYLLSIDSIDVMLKGNQGKSPIFWATRPNNKRMIELFRKRGIKALHTMVTKRDDLEKVKLLLEAGYDASRVDAQGCTPMRRAVKAGNLESAKLLIHECPQSVNEKDMDDR